MNETWSKLVEKQINLLQEKSKKEDITIGELVSLSEAISSLVDASARLANV